MQQRRRGKRLTKVERYIASQGTADDGGASFACTVESRQAVPAFHGNAEPCANCTLPYIYTARGHGPTGGHCTHKACTGCSPHPAVRCKHYLCYCIPNPPPAESVPRVVHATKLGRNSAEKGRFLEKRVPKSACTFGRRKSKEAEMSFLVCEETNRADFALTMPLLAKSYSPQAKLEKSIEENKSTSPKDVPARQGEKALLRRAQKTYRQGENTTKRAAPHGRPSI